MPSMSYIKRAEARKRREKNNERYCNGIMKEGLKALLFDFEKKF